MGPIHEQTCRKIVERFVGDPIRGGSSDRLFDAVSAQHEKVGEGPTACSSVRATVQPRVPLAVLRETDGGAKAASRAAWGPSAYRARSEYPFWRNHFGLHQQLLSDLTSGTAPFHTTLPLRGVPRFPPKSPTKARRRSWQPWYLWRAWLDCRASSPTGYRGFSVPGTAAPLTQCRSSRLSYIDTSKLASIQALEIAQIWRSHLSAGPYGTQRRLAGPPGPFSDTPTCRRRWARVPRAKERPASPHRARSWQARARASRPCFSPGSRDASQQRASCSVAPCRQMHSERLAVRDHPFPPCRARRPSRRVWRDVQFSRG